MSVTSVLSFFCLQVPSERGRADETGYEECIVPSDMNLLSGTFLVTVGISNPLLPARSFTPEGIRFNTPVT